MSDQFSIETTRYQGPLETLLDLIEDRKMSITDISLAEVTDAFLSYVEKLPQLPLGETSQFILVASTLLLIKSRTLLPTLELSASEEESVHELERRLARLHIIRAASKLIKKERWRKTLMLARRAPLRPAVFSPAESSIATISAAALKLVNVLPKPAELAKAAVAPVLALEDVIVGLKKRLTTAFRARFSELTQSKDRHEVIVYFLAMLELVRSGHASVSQEKLFEDIEIEIEGATGIPRYGV